MARPPLHALTGLRFVTAMHIVAFHFGASLSFLPDWLYRALAGPGGVGLFFVLSGFILVYVYYDAEARFRGSPQAFWSLRLARIYPIYLFGLVLSMPFYLEVELPAVLAVLSLVQAWVPQFALAWNAPAWAVAAMAFFYLLLPFLGTLLRFLLRRERLLLVAMLLLVFFQPTVYWLVERQQLGEAWLSWATYFPPLRLPEFLLGALCGALFLRARPEPLKGGLFSALAAALVLAVMAAGFHASGFFYKPLLLAGFALLICSLAQGEGPLEKLLSWRGAVLLGRASYAIYILQFPVWAWLVRAFPGHSAEPVFFLLYAGVLVGFGLLSFYTIEHPLRRYLVASAAGRARHEEHPRRS